MKEKEDPETELEAGEASDHRVFADVVSGYIGAATTALRDRDFDAGLTFIGRALRACEAAPSRALVSQELATLDALALAAVEQVPADRAERAAALRQRVTDFRKLRLH